MCAYNNRQHCCTDVRKFSSAQQCVPNVVFLLVWHTTFTGTQRNRAPQPCLPYICHESPCDVLVVGAEPPTAFRRNGTGVLWVSTWTHRCDDPPRQGGGSSKSQLVHCVDCNVRSCVWMRLSQSNTPPRLKHACGFRRLEWHLATLRPVLVHSESSSLQSCHCITALSSSIHVNSTEQCKRRSFSHSLPRTLSHLLATPIHGQRRNHTRNRSPCRHCRRFYTH